MSSTGEDTTIVSADRLRDLELAFATLSATLTTKLDNIAESIKADSTRHDDHENRIRGLEMKVWVACGAALAGGGAVGTIGGYLLGL